MTSAFLKAWGNSPVESDLLTICMIMGVRKSLQDFTSPVGKGSSAHCLFGEAAMMHWISCSVAGCSISIGALTRGLGWGGCCISTVISPNGCLNGNNLVDKKK